MSKTDDSQKNLPEPYRVGYRRPPVEHRFRKGQSGNPNGRPKGSSNKPQIDNGLGMRGAEEFLRLEAYRSVTIREGENTIELPAIQAVFRAMGVSAMKGNRFAQRTMAELVGDLERRDSESRLELFGNAIEYKHAWDAEIERCEKENLPVPDPVPHPDDIILNPGNGSVEILGPQTKEQKARLDKALQRRTDAQKDVNYFADKYRKARSAEQKSRWLKEWHWEQGMFDLLNDIVSGRYKAKLENRSYREGASREGEQLERVRRERSERKKYLG